MRNVLAVSALLIAGAVGALPVSNLRVLQGSVDYRPGRGGPGSSVIRLELQNLSQVPLEGLRLRMVFRRTPVPADVTEGWRARYVAFDPPLKPGETRTVTVSETGTALHSRIEITRLFPLLQVTVRGQALQSEIAPYLWQGSVHGAVAEIARALGWRTEWSDAWAMASIIGPAHALVLQENSHSAAIDGKLLRLPGKMRVARGNLVGPLAVPLRAMGLTVEYDEDLNTLNIDRPAQGEAASGQS
ncbi:MAG: hypothetical protein HPY44_06065 [Armatimonadetes bacterium]|nr:hypothetical protein [Armatimonadota bacterium]